jgi:AcrR family transcriptional regulator
MTGDRRKFRREGEEKRRDALVAAALELVSEGGLEAATVRAIAERAGVTPGLIRHYFDSKEALTRAAFGRMMAHMTEISLEAAGEAGSDPLARLVAYVRASFRPPVLEPGRIALWTGFMNAIRIDPDLRDVHREQYLHYRDLLQDLLMQIPGFADPARARSLAIACNAVIDGLWMEGGMLPEVFDAGELERIALMSVGAILGLRLEEDRG